MEESFGFSQRLQKLLEAKEKQKKQKLEKYGRTLDLDDRGSLVPPAGFRFVPVPNHPSGGFFGAKSCGENYRRLLECHPICIEPYSSLLGGWMVMLSDYRDLVWHPDIPFSHLHSEQERYDIVHGIGGLHHFLADYALGLRLGWKGILEKINHYRRINTPEKDEFYEALTNCVLGIQNMIRRHAECAEKLSQEIADPFLKQNLSELSAMNYKLIEEPPDTFHEAVQWMAWYMVAANIYNGCGSTVGEIDAILKPFYDKDRASGMLDDEEATFHICCFLLIDNAYCQIGGTDKDGNDKTNAVSFIVLEAVHKMKIPASVCVRVHEKLNRELFFKAVSNLFRDRTGSPNFIGDKAINEGYMKNGYTLEQAVNRIKCGCHWCATAGREYTLNDVVKINFAAVFEVAFKEMTQDISVTPSTSRLWELFLKHLKRAVEITAEGIDFHLEHMHQVFPELANDLCCHGTIEKGLDATHGGVELYNMCVDGAGLAIVADSFAALEQRIEKEKRVTWKQVAHTLENNFRGAEEFCMMLKNIPHYGNGGSIADVMAVRITKAFVQFVKEKPTPRGFNMIPGLFSWANTIPMGKAVGATPNGRLAGEPISHGANPVPGFKQSGALTALANAVASVQCGYGNTVPVQLEINPVMLKGEEGIKTMMSFIDTYCNVMGGTLMNINILNREMVLDAHRDPSKYPEIIVRVTGFSAYFALLSEDFRKLVVDRIINE